ncbi:MAG: GNAT family N-acetyltransferase [Bacteroidota bacterium]|nr:GNAT family N-acetyltransferase [Bacteroidota bacterium]
MMSAFVIRAPETEVEWNTVRQLLIDYQDEFDDKACFTSFEDEFNNLESVYAESGKYKLIAIEESTGKIVGCVAIRTLSPGVAEMKRLYLVPQYRGFQLGRKLATAIMELATQHGYHQMLLDTMYEMKAAQRLYEQLGFAVIPSYGYQEGLDVICYGKDLP